MDSSLGNRGRRSTHIFVPARTAEDWKPLLAEPEKHWRPGFSAHSLAHSWQGADGFPASVQKVLQASGIRALHDLEFLLGLPEHQVPLPPDGGAASQTDLWVLANGPDGLVSIAVEGKVRESFGEPVTDWLGSHPSPGKVVRLQFLCERLGFSPNEVGSLRYQLLHRLVSALLEAKRFGSRHALMLVHSFSAANDGLQDYQALAKTFGCTAFSNAITEVGERVGIQLYLGWIAEPPR